MLKNDEGILEEYKWVNLYSIWIILMVRECDIKVILNIKNDRESIGLVK